MTNLDIPTFIYGTAWKGDATTKLVKLAISKGFSAIDTANQPKHYYESLVGQALWELEKEGITREQLFLQTKFTPLNGHDDRIPYDPKSDLEIQVLTSFQSSLQHLHTDYVDSYLLHGPYAWPSLGDSDWKVWRTLEKLYASGKAKKIGISNVNLEQLKLLVDQSKIKPMIVQNRCYASQGWDYAIRKFCKENHIIYQGFSLLTANRDILKNHKIQGIAKELDKTVEQIIFRFCMQIGILPLTGTCSEQHMIQDLQALHFELNENQMECIQSIHVEIIVTGNE